VAAAAANLSMRHSCVQGRRYVAAIYHRLKRGEYHTDQLKGNYLKMPEDHHVAMIRQKRQGKMIC
jgi:hypothetical protein